MGALRIVTAADVQAVMTMELALDLARRTLLDQAAGRSLLSTPSAMTLDATPVGGPRFKFKAAAVGHLGASGIRLLAHPGPTSMQTANYCAVYDHGSFHLAGLVSEHSLSRVRTAAFGTVSLQPLVNPGPLVVTMFGAGGIADEMVPMLQRALQISELRVSSRRAESMNAFARKHGGRPEPDGRKAVEGADLVITLTESPTPLVFPGTLKPGAVVCSMGSYNELDFGVLGEAQRFVVDDPDFAAEMGDGGAWIEQGRITRQAFLARVDAQACDVVAGKKSGRRSPSERIVAIIQGMAIGDVAFAAQVLREAENRGLGRVVELD
jgi:ornithine cyclodeaminase/alanine dehydrogenase-like protein (mu-crystallin family)